MKLLNCSFQNSKPFENRSNVIENRHPDMTQNVHVYAIYCRLEVAGDVIFGQNVKTIQGYALLNFEVASFSTLRDIKTRMPTNC